MHGGLPKIEAVKNHCQSRKYINGKIKDFHPDIRPFMVAHCHQQHNKNVIVNTGQHGKACLQTFIKTKLVYHKKGFAQIKNTDNNNGKIALQSVRHTLSPVIQYICYLCQNAVTQYMIKNLKAKLIQRKGVRSAEALPGKKSFYYAGRDNKNQPAHFSAYPIHLTPFPCLRQKLNRLGLHLD